MINKLSGVIIKFYSTSMPKNFEGWEAKSMDFNINKKIRLDLGVEIYGMVYFKKSGFYNIVLNSNCPEEDQEKAYQKAYKEVAEKKPTESWYIKDLDS